MSRFMYFFLLIAVTALAADFSGDWILDAEKSDMPTVRGDRPSDRGERGRGMQGGNRNRAPMINQEMQVQLEENELTINSKSSTRSGADVEQSRTYQIDGNEHTIPTDRGDLTYTAEWEGDVLKLNANIAFETPRGMMDIATTETWHLEDDGKTLKIEKEMQTPRGERSSTVFYNRQ